MKMRTYLLNVLFVWVGGGSEGRSREKGISYDGVGGVEARESADDTT